MSGPIKLHNFKGQLMTASQIAHAHALSLPTVMRRLNRGLEGDALVAAPYSLARVADGHSHKPSERPMTASEARYHLKRAEAGHAKAWSRYLNAIKAGDTPSIQSWLKTTLDKATFTLSYWRERVRMAEEVVPVKAPRIKGRWSPKPEPDQESEVSSANPEELATLFEGE